jgi:cell division protease FtsH
MEEPAAGMAAPVGPLQYAEPEEEVFLGYSVNRTRQMSNETAQLIDKEIRRLVDDAYDKAKTCLDDNRDQLESLAQALLEYETLSGEEIKALMAEGKAAADKARQARVAAIAAGKKPRYCPPDGPQAMPSSEFMTRLSAIPPAERAHIDMTEAMNRILERKFPCKS